MYDPNYGENEEKVDLTAFVSGIRCTKLSTQHENAKAIRLHLSRPNNPPIKQLIDTGIIPKLIQLAQDHEHPQLQYESLWILLNIASGPPEAVAYLFRNNAHSCFISLLKSSQFYEIKEQAMYVQKCLCFI